MIKGFSMGALTTRLIARHRTKFIEVPEKDSNQGKPKDDMEFGETSPTRVTIFIAEPKNVIKGDWGEKKWGKLSNIRWKCSVPGVFDVGVMKSPRQGVASRLQKKES